MHPLSAIILDTIRGGGTVYVCGNGGSASQAQHFAAELVVRFRPVARRALPALSLVGDVATLTAIANDFGYDQIFARQVEAYGRPGDLLICLSTSGRSPNVIRAADAAEVAGVTVAVVGGERIDDTEAWIHHACSRRFTFEGDTAQIQEQTLSLIHRVCGEVETVIAGEESAA